MPCYVITSTENADRPPNIMGEKNAVLPTEGQEMFKQKNTGKNHVEQSDFMQAATLQISDRREKPLVIYCNSFHQAADLLIKLCTAACS